MNDAEIIVQALIEQDRTKVFEDVDGWKAVRLEGASGITKAYSIFDENNIHVAFISSNGQLNIRKNERLESTDRIFDTDTELKQAVQYTYLTLQKPKSV